MRQKIEHMQPAATNDIREIISRCEGDPHLQALGDMVRVIANTGLFNGEFASLRKVDIDVSGTWLHVGRPRSVASPSRTLPLRPRTYAALVSLHESNPNSDLILGDKPRTRFENMIRKLKILAPQLPHTRDWSCSIRFNFESRLFMAGIPTGVVKYVLGRESLRSSLSDSNLTHEQKLEVARRSLGLWSDSWRSCRRVRFCLSRFGIQITAILRPLTYRLGQK
jgi:integrase